MAEPNDMIVPMLREMRAESRADTAELRAETRAGFSELRERMGRIEDQFKNVKQAVYGESVLGRYAAAEVEDRLEAMERRLSALESKR